MSKALDALEQVERALPRDSFDPQAVLEAVGRDPSAITEWVRANTRWVPYQGALRGPVGVLMDRVGNSLDRSLLLAELLISAGHTVRLARAQLTAEQVEAAISTATARRAPPMPARPSEQEIDQYAQLLGLDRQEVRAAIDAVAQRFASMRRIGEAQSESLLQAIGPVPPANAPSPPPVQAAQDHWWVQVQQGSNWVDHDPLLLPGATRPDGQDTFDCPQVDASAAVPAEMWHSVTIRVIVELWNGEGFEETTVLEHQLRPGQLLHQRVSLSHIPTRIEPSDPECLLDQKQWVPVLWIGPRPVFQNCFDDTGVVKAVTPPGADAMGQQAQRAVGGLGDALGGGEDEGEAEVVKSVLTAQWVEYVIEAPGGEARTLRREVFDISGPSARAAVVAPVINDRVRLDRVLKIGGETEILLAVCAISAAFTQHLYAQRMIAGRGALEREFAQLAAGQVPTGDVLAQPRPPGPVYDLAQSRNSLSPVAGDVYIDSINVLTNSVWLQAPEAEGVQPPATLIRERFDIVANDVAVHRDVPDPFRVRLIQGVVDTVAESFAHGGTSLNQNTSLVFEAAAKKQIGSTVVRTPDELDALASTIGLVADARHRAGEALAGGKILVFPSQAIEATEPGWWEISTGSGTSIGVMSSGFRGDTVEYALAVHTPSLASGAFQDPAEYGGLTETQVGQLLRYLNKGEQVQVVRATMQYHSHRATGYLLLGFGMFIGVMVMALAGWAASQKPPPPPRYWRG